MPRSGTIIFQQQVDYFWDALLSLKERADEGPKIGCYQMTVASRSIFGERMSFDGKISKKLLNKVHFLKKR
jgi:hypothetical protein